MDKVMMKRAFAAVRARHRARTSSSATVHDRDALADAVEAELGYPCFVKPANLGLVGRGVEGRRPRRRSTPRATLALGFDEWILVEEAITGREIEVAVLGDDPPEASVPGEIVPGAEFYSYADKYEARRRAAPRPRAARPTRRPRMRSARGARRSTACRCEAMARVDLSSRRRGARASS